jgi:hypothetical protein
MKRSLLTVFRAMVFAVCIFLLATVGGFEITSGRGVAVFLVAIAFGWIVLEKVLATALQQRRKQKVRPY